MSEWHSYVQYDLLGEAKHHEYVVPGARIDVAVERINSDRLVGLEVQFSPIKKETVLKRHEAHRKAGIAGTVWLIHADTVSADDWVRKVWVQELLQACLETPASAPGESAYGCVVGLVDLHPTDPYAEPSIRFIDRVVEDNLRGKKGMRILSYGSSVRPEVLRLWAQGRQRPTQIPEDIQSEIRSMDAVPTRRVKGPVVHTFSSARWS